jgi:NAD(P)-dependent dehydrogenase (short-subunit alcohol dehydrogenase family)
LATVALTPFSSVYHGSKAAAVMFSDYRRIELAPFGITVIDPKAGCEVELPR